MFCFYGVPIPAIIFHLATPNCCLYCGRSLLVRSVRVCSCKGLCEHRGLRSAMTTDLFYLLFLLLLLLFHPGVRFFPILLAHDAVVAGKLAKTELRTETFSYRRRHIGFALSFCSFHHFSSRLIVLEVLKVPKTRKIPSFIFKTLEENGN